jgi:hypothetical protein
MQVKTGNNTPGENAPSITGEKQPEHNKLFPDNDNTFFLPLHYNILSRLLTTISYENMI